jgi:hypothetical protein
MSKRSMQRSAINANLRILVLTCVFFLCLARGASSALGEYTTHVPPPIHSSVAYNRHRHMRTGRLVGAIARLAVRCLVRLDSNAVRVGTRSVRVFRIHLGVWTCDRNTQGARTRLHSHHYLIFNNALSRLGTLPYYSRTRILCDPWVALPGSGV